KRFFTDTYQRFDFPLPGAKRFVEAVHRAGATVCYLTGRDVGRMLVGTTESLRQYGFPVGIVGTMTIVKTDFKLDDAAFKHETVDYLQRLGSVVAVFENEPENANMFLGEFPYAESFLLNTHHRPDAPALHERIHVIQDFRCSPRSSAA
ncbi:MAG: haloacid dehalogenase-like hydrolase, partial [Myxococcota bacterium]|nr:haloacid dehalogenase-like hydrolase [Myxococcota bacterium]